MYRKGILCILHLILLQSCKHQENDNSTRDKALKLFIERNDSINRDSNNSFSFGLDSSDYSYKTLKAYHYNDTNFLKKLISDLEKASPDKLSIDTFEKNNIPNLRNLNINEGYQFRYGETFCNLEYVITITRADSLIQLKSIVYAPLQNNMNNTFKLKVVENNTKKLSYANWEELLNALNFADYWNLLPRSKELEEVLDPSSLTILGIKKEVNEVTYLKSNHDIEDTRKCKKETRYETKRTHRVERLLFRNTALCRPFALALQYSGMKKLCNQTIKDY